jgi:opacity protein-like surface antigen
MSRLNLIRTALACMLLTVCAAPAAAIDLGGHVRDGVVIGLDLGYGWHEVDATYEGNTLDTGQSGAFSGGFRVGWARSDNLIGSLGIYGWKKSYYQELTPFTVTDFLFLAELAWFPRGEGFWIRGGVGGGSFDITITTPEAKTTYKQGGWNYSLGAGYELRVAETTALGVTYDLRYVDVGDFEVFERVSTFSQNVALSIRFYML